MMFQKVKEMNEAFMNPEGDPLNPDWPKIRNQAMNIIDEFGELMVALGAPKGRIDAAVTSFKANIHFHNEPVMDDVRDALCDINVFSLGTHHLMGVDAVRDMTSVLDAIMSRFVKDEADYHATVALHRAKGVPDTYPVGAFPNMIIKSARKQPDAPEGKFLKSASYHKPIFYDIKNDF